jgi:hypothetical protein
MVISGCIGFAASNPLYLVGFYKTGVIWTNIVGLSLLPIFIILLNKTGYFGPKEQLTGWKSSYLLTLLIIVIGLFLFPQLLTRTQDTKAVSATVSGIALLVGFALSWALYTSLVSLFQERLDRHKIQDSGISQIIDSKALSVTIALLKTIVSQIAGAMFLFFTMAVFAVLKIEFGNLFMHDFTCFFNILRTFSITNYACLFGGIIIISTALAYLSLYHSRASYDSYARRETLNTGAEIWMSLFQFLEPIVGALLGLYLLKEPTPQYIVLSSFGLFGLVILFRVTEVSERVLKNNRETYLGIMNDVLSKILQTNVTLKDPLDVTHLFKNSKLNKFRRIAETPGGKIFCLKIQNGKDLLFYREGTKYLSYVLNNYLQKNKMGFISKDDPWSIYISGETIDQLNTLLDLSDNDTALLIATETEAQERIGDEVKRELERLLDVEDTLIRIGAGVFYDTEKLILPNPKYLYVPSKAKRQVETNFELGSGESRQKKISDINRQLQSILDAHQHRDSISLHLFLGARHILNSSQMNQRRFLALVERWLQRNHPTIQIVDIRDVVMIANIPALEKRIPEYNSQEDALIMVIGEPDEIKASMSKLRELFEKVNEGKKDFTNSFFFKHL